MCACPPCYENVTLQVVLCPLCLQCLARAAQRAPCCRQCLCFAASRSCPRVICSMVFCLPKSRSLGDTAAITESFDSSHRKLQTRCPCTNAQGGVWDARVAKACTASPSSFALPFVFAALVVTKQRPFQSEDFFFPFLPNLHFSIVENSMIDVSLCQVPKHVFFRSCQKKQGCSFCPASLPSLPRESSFLFRYHSGTRPTSPSFSVLTVPTCHCQICHLPPTPQTLLIP